ncbi:MAG TPA: WecB/TagA/CpsF family glycosyltransferase [Clostridiaceae bacterium]|nr:WecB/TagA/CpsF family glycosyltransferase [Clostridiaceae bacterium]
MRKTVNILGIPVDKITMEEAVERVGFFLGKYNMDKGKDNEIDNNYENIKNNHVKTVYTPNSEIMMAAQRDEELRKILCSGNMLVPDGAGVVLAAKILGYSLPERVAGFDLVENILAKFSGSGLRVFLLGAKPGVAEKAAINIITKYKGIEISGYHHGYFTEEEVETIINKINESSTDLLLVALGAPKQEKWIHRHKDQLKVKVCIGVGGTLDVFAGVATRAPKFFQDHGLEWLYRLYKEPRRFWRMLDIPRFLLLAAKTKFMQIFQSRN